MRWEVEHVSFWPVRYGSRPPLPEKWDYTILRMRACRTGVSESEGLLRKQVRGSNRQGKRTNSNIGEMEYKSVAGGQVRRVKYVICRLYLVGSCLFLLGYVLFAFLPPRAPLAAAAAAAAADEVGERCLIFEGERADCRRSCNFVFSFVHGRLYTHT